MQWHVGTRHVPCVIYWQSGGHQGLYACTVGSLRAMLCGSRLAAAAVRIASSARVRCAVRDAGGQF